MTAEIAKIEAETRALTRHETPEGRRWERWRTVAGLTGAATAAVAVLGFLLSAFQWGVEQRGNREESARQRLASAISDATAAEPAKQIAGISSLAAYFPELTLQERQQVLTILASMFPHEQDPLIRRSMVVFFKRLKKNDLTPTVLADVLQTLVDASRGLVENGELYAKRALHPAEVIDPKSVEARARDLGEAISETVRVVGAGAIDLSGIYCVACNFSKIELAESRFDDAILYLADFSDANLKDASFNRADIEHTSFVNADLRGARLTHDDGAQPGNYRRTYVGMIFDRDPEGQVAVFGPDFSCADLAGADFSGHPIFGFASDAPTRPVASNAAGSTEEGADTNEFPSLLVFSANFAHANLAQAMFQSSLMYGAKRPSEALPFSGGNGMSASNAKGIAERFEFDFSDYDFAAPDPTLYQGGLYFLQSGFAGSTWKQATLPAPMRSWLDKNPPMLNPNDEDCEPSWTQRDASASATDAGSAVAP